MRTRNLAEHTLLIGAVLAGTGEPQHALDYMVHHLGLGGVCSAVVHLLALPAAYDELAGLQVFQMVGDCGARHAGSL